MVSQIKGYKTRINNKNDNKGMDKYLQEALELDLVITKLGEVKDYLPVNAPLLDYLVTDTEGPTGWKYPKFQELRKFQDKQGLTYSLLEDVEVCEVICGVLTTEEIKNFHEWTTDRPLKNQENFNSGVISMDIEDMKASYYVMRTAGKIVISKDSQPLQRHLDNRLVAELQEDGWKQSPGKIMFGECLTWCVIISLPNRMNKKGEYIVERIHPQPQLLQVLRVLPVCTG